MNEEGLKMKSRTTVDPIVDQYWQRERQFQLSSQNKILFSPEANLKKYEEYRKRKTGLLERSSTVLLGCVSQIAVGLIDMGLANAAIAKKIAETALEVGDMGEYKNPPYPYEFGMYRNLNNLNEANWILTGQKDDNLKKSLEYLTIVRNNYEPPRKKMSAGDRWAETWAYVVSYLIGGDIAEAKYQFRQIHGVKNIDIEKIDTNSKDFIKCIHVVLEYLGKRRDKAKLIAADTFDGFYYNITGWGHHGTSPRDKLWKELTLHQHFLIARIRAEYFTGERNPIKIIQSIKGAQES